MDQTPFRENIWGILEERLFPVPSGPDLFNQYKDNDPEYDLPDGSRIRRENLKNYLMSFKKRPEILLVGEAAGPWGCRFSGVPFTSEYQLQKRELPFKGQRSSRHEPPYKESTGSILWGTLLPEFPRFFLWNAVPLHPHKEGRPLTIRTPGPQEIMDFSPLLKELWKAIGARRVIAVGRKAQSALEAIEVPHGYVRHPSQSGAPEFREDIKKVFSAAKGNPVSKKLKSR